MTPNRVSILLAAGLVFSMVPAFAQTTAPRWKPTPETITITAAPVKDWRALLTGTHISTVFAISASIGVPYSDLNLVRDTDDVELNRRIGVAARVVCEQLDLKYPPSRYVSLGDDNCVDVANRDGLSRAHDVIAAAKK